MPLRKLLGLKKSKKGEQSNPPSQYQGPQSPQHQNNTQHQPYQYPNYRQPVSAVPLPSPQQGYQVNQQALVRFPGPRLCQVCNNLNFADIIRPGGVAQHTSLSALRAAAAWGCVLCNILHHGLLRSDYNKIRLTERSFSDTDPGFHFRIFKHAKYDCMGVRAGPFSPQQLQDVGALQKWLETGVKYNEMPFWVSAENIEVKLWENPGNPATALLSDVSPLAPKPKKPWSDEYFAEIKTALDTCISSHVVFPSFGEDDEPQLPNRVLFVGTLQAPEIHLFEPHTFPNGRRAYYAALSYCWGPSQNLRLLTTTLEAFKSGITEDMLPRTILEAVYITRRLGLLFLWVDALCIIQDSTDDWKAESMLMASVYHNAWVTIGAGIASSVHEGVIVSSPPALELELAQLPFFDPYGTRIATAFIGLEPDKEFVPIKLRSRGWCFQEELLSPRFLLFDDENWELCCQNCKVENRHDQSRLAHAFFGTHDPDEEHWEAFRQVEHNIHHNWRALMERYSLRSLTVASDKLVAISGLAKLFQAVTHDTYVAGGWAKSIAHDIMWEMQQAPVREDDPRKGEAKFLAPSWSWVSVDAGVIWPYNNEMEDSDVVVTNISINLTYENLSTSEYDPFGPLLGGHVNMQGKMKEGKISCIRSVGRSGFESFDFSFEASTPEEGEPPQSLRESKPRIKLDYLSAAALPKTEQLSGTEWVTGTVYALEVLKTAGLIIEPVEGHAGIYRRIGRYSLPQTLASMFASTSAFRLLGPKSSGPKPPTYKVLSTNPDGSVVIDASNPVYEESEEDLQRMYADWWFGRVVANVVLI